MEKGPMTPERIVLIGGSAGSLEVLMQVLPDLEPRIDFPVVIVLHRKNSEDTTLEDLIAMKTALAVNEVEDKTPLLGGCVYVVPSDYHLLFEHDGTLALDDSEKVHYSRPSIDVTFESAAAAFRDKCVGILLSGSNADGAQGCLRIKEAGGLVVVQDPQTAEMEFMPKSAIAVTRPDIVVAPGEIAALINRI